MKHFLAPIRLVMTTCALSVLGCMADLAQDDEASPTVDAESSSPSGDMGKADNAASDCLNCIKGGGGAGCISRCGGESEECLAAVKGGCKAGADTSQQECVDACSSSEIGNLTDFPYYYQYDNAINPGGSCQNTSMAMVLRHYGAPSSATPDSISSRHGTSAGQTVAGWQSVFRSEAERYGLNVTSYGTTKGSLEKVRGLLAAGRPVVVHGYFTAYGHVLVLVGYDGSNYIANDPAGRWSQQYQYGGYCACSRTEGKMIKYRKDALEQAIAPDGYVWMHEFE